VTVYAIPVPSLSLSVDKTSGYPGDTFNFMGNFAQNGTPVVGETVTLYRNGVLVGSATSDGVGDYLIPWVADIEGALSFHTEAAIPSRPPTLSRMINLGVGLQESPLLPILLSVGIGTVFVGAFLA